ncbi:hypothetical protein BH18ACT1_BH18ACT1_08410 [soil metagenome]
MAELQAEGKVRHIGVSNVNAELLSTARSMVDVVSVQNQYNLADRRSEGVLATCEAEGIAAIPWFPLATGDLARPGGPVDDVANRKGVPPGHVALAWLLQHSPVMLPIPGTSSVEHLEENVAAAALRLDDEDLATLDGVAAPS